MSGLEGGFWKLFALSLKSIIINIKVRKGEFMEIKIEKPTQEKLKELGVENWPIWECDVSEFDWYYDTDERCYMIEGKVVVETPQGEVEIKKGDLVLFPKGLSCRWKVKEKIRKYYSLE